MLRELSFFVASTIFFAMASDVDPNDILFTLLQRVIGPYLVKFVRGGQSMVVHMIIKSENLTNASLERVD